MCDYQTYLPPSFLYNVFCRKRLFIKCRDTTKCVWSTQHISWVISTTLSCHQAGCLHVVSWVTAITQSNSKQSVFTLEWHYWLRTFWYWKDTSHLLRRSRKQNICFLALDASTDNVEQIKNTTLATSSQQACLLGTLVEYSILVGRI